ncbi:MAG: dihydroorotate dehydrogenase [Elusimicrobia bacterium]|nr:dihydroorotate dehydrogenase [Elusimicrobiota bacterium]MBD3412767.1 dihydroorotate dehydrogenase [Elusimicrobiota bacterium]
MKRIDLSTSIGRLRFSNPIVVASGTFGYGDEFKKIIKTNALGGIITKTITARPRPGNPPPRLVETPSGLLNSIGLQNVGFESFVTHKLPRLSFISVPIIMSIAGESEEEFETLAEQSAAFPRIAGLELNLSCPNVADDGRVFGNDPATIHAVVQRVCSVYGKPVIAKLSPMVADIVACAQAAHAAGAEGVTIANTFPGMCIDVHARVPRLGNIIGGLSGPAIRPLSLRLTWLVARHTSLPIIASGGITSANDALEYLIAGARAIAIGTGLYRDVNLPVTIIMGIKTYLKKHRIRKLTSLMGSLTCKNSSH